MRTRAAPLAQPLARGKLLLAAGFLRQPYATPLATAWRATDAAPAVETPFLAVADAATLALEDVRALHRTPGAEPTATARPCGFARAANGTYAVLLTEGTDIFVATFSLQHCAHGIVHEGACLCPSGRATAPDACEPEDNGGASSSRDPGRLVVDSSEAEGFFGSVLAVALFGATAAVFFILAVVFISLFAVAKRRRSSSGSLKSTEME